MNLIINTPIVKCVENMEYKGQINLKVTFLSS